MSIADAFATWRSTRANYDTYRTAMLLAAGIATNGRLLNAEGSARGIEPASLFMGNTARAHKYASAELLEHWTRHPRVTFAEYERQRAAEACRADRTSTADLTPYANHPGKCDYCGATLTGQQQRWCCREHSLIEVIITHDTRRPTPAVTADPLWQPLFEVAS